MVQHLLEAGADPSLPASGEPPLLTCARTGRVEAVERLLARGADPNAADDWKGQTAVMWATAEDHVAVVETLVAHGADVNMAATPGETALFVAVQLGLDDSVRALLAAGADVTVTSPGDRAVVARRGRRRSPRARGRAARARSGPERPR